MSNEGGEFNAVLREAQEKGYAEMNPSLDIDGIDAAHKLAILIKLAFGAQVPFEDIFIEGISEITPLDIEFGREFGYAIKLLAIAKADYPPGHRIRSGVRVCDKAVGYRQGRWRYYRSPGSSHNASC
jgi:homoserine dehydrogenase